MEFGTLLSFLYTPALRSFSYDLRYGREEEHPEEAIRDFMERSQPPLIRFEVEEIYFTAEQLIPILRLIPTVEELSIRTLMHERLALFRELARGLPGRCGEKGRVVAFCPRLTRLCLSGLCHPDLLEMDRQSLEDTVCKEVLPLRHHGSLTEIYFQAEGGINRTRLVELDGLRVIFHEEAMKLFKRRCSGKDARSG